MGHKQTINQIKAIVDQKNLNPTELRYIFAQVRKQTGLSVPKGRKSLPHFLNAAEVYKFLEVCSQDKLDGILAEFLISTGLRISEARNLLIQDIDFMNNQIRVVSGKGNKDREVPITNNLLHKIKLFVGDRNKGYLFMYKEYKQYSIRALQTRIKNRLVQCGFTKQLSTHSLRHTFACICLSRGMDIAAIKLLMGHSSIKTTEIYAKLELSSIKEKFLQLMNGL